MRALIALFLSLVVFSAGALAEPPAKDLSPEKKLKEIKEELKESKEQLQKTRREEQAVLGRLAVIGRELKQTNQTLNRAQKKIRTNETQVGMLKTEVNQRWGDLQDKEKKLKNRIKEIYKSSSLNYLELLITSRSMSDFFNRLYFFGKIIEYDARLVEGVRSDLQEVKQKKAVLEKKTDEIRELAKVVAGKKEEITVRADEKKELYQSLQRRRKEYEERIAELEKSSVELEVLILKTTAARKGAGVRGSGILAWPLEGRLTSRFGYRRHPYWGGRQFHTGIDIAAKHGTPIKAADAGEVIFSGWWDGYGKAVVVDHGRQMTTVYAHLSRIYKQVGEIIAKGQILGLVGSTGYSTGPHLHFEVRKNGKPVNPMGYL